MEQAIRNFLNFLRALPVAHGPCCKKCCNYRTPICRAATLLRYASSVETVSLDPLVADQGLYSGDFSGDRTPVRRFFWVGSVQEFTSESLMSSFVQTATNSYYEPNSAIRISRCVRMQRENHRTCSIHDAVRRRRCLPFVRSVV